MGLPRSALLSDDAVTLLTVDVDGRVFRMSHSRVVVTSSVLGDLVYEAGLGDVDLTQALDIFSSGSESPSVSVEALWPVPLAPVVMAGHQLSQAPAELSRWVPGVSFEDRLVVLAGRVSSPEWGSEEALVKFSVELGDLTDTATIPDARDVTEEAVWDTSYLGEGDVGLTLPIIIGYPGIDATRTSGCVTGSHAVWLSKRTYQHLLLIAGHPVEAATVLVNCDADPDGQVVEVGTVVDRRGLTRSVIKMGPLGYDDPASGSYLGPDYAPDVSATATITVGWFAGSGGMLGPDGKVMRRAGDVLTWALQESDVACDLGACAAQAPKLAPFLVDAKVDASVAPLDWARSTLLPWLPASLVAGPRGYSFVVWDWMATDEDATFWVDLDQEDGSSWRDSDVEEDDSTVVNEVTLQYCRSDRLNSYTKSVTAGAWSPLPAVAELTDLGDTIRVTALQEGTAGAGITITATAGGAISVTEDVTARTVTVDYTNLISTTDDILDRLNALTLVRADLVSGDGTTAWNDVNGDQTATTTSPSTVTVGVAACTASVARYGRRAKTVQSPVTYDDATAALQARYLVVSQCEPRRRVRVVVPEADHPGVEVGAVGLLTDSTISFDGQLVLVERLVPLPAGRLGLGLVCIPGRA